MGKCISQIGGFSILFEGSAVHGGILKKADLHAFMRLRSFHSSYLIYELCYYK